MSSLNSNQESTQKSEDEILQIKIDVYVCAYIIKIFKYYVRFDTNMCHHLAVQNEKAHKHTKHYKQELKFLN